MSTPESSGSKRLRVLAIDWSGRRVRAERHIWLAEARENSLVRLEPGRSREEIAEHLLELAQGDSPMVVGLDFAFSFPQWFLSKHVIASAPELWSWLALGEANRILAACDSPFWGRPGRKKPQLQEHFRVTDRGSAAKSVFQIGGAGAVGTGSLRGMCVLDRLVRGGISVWPMMPQGTATLIEIYPRVLTGPVNKSSPARRLAYLEQGYPHVRGEILERAASSEDAFDAAVSALVMSQHRPALASLPVVQDEQIKVEGWIWDPGRAVPI
jgi:hypothetical protein